ncbi:hypothetical protein [Dyadobacter bucti]|uniref:hypothetical protein n=1 Tax=Dyadobacter bucti TaxID=2572203 RepID=UPI003F6E7213
MNNSASLKLRHATECLNHVQARLAGNLELFYIEDVNQRGLETREFTARYDQKWFELKQRHFEEISTIQHFEVQN